MIFFCSAGGDAAGVATGGDQDVFGAQSSSRCGDFPAACAFALNLVDMGVLEDSGSGAFGGAGEPGDESGRIQAGASSVNQSAVINSGANFGLELVFGDDALFMIKMARGFVSAAAEIVEMFWFASHFEMAAAREIAGDIFFAN